VLNAFVPSAEPSITALAVPLSLFHALSIVSVLIDVVVSYLLAVVVFKL